MPIEFFELPQGTPSVVPVSTGTGYCSASDVASLNRARVIGQGQNPTLTDVNGFILMAAGQIDAVLLKAGFDVPVNTASFPEVEGLLTWVNAAGANAMLEASVPTNPGAADRAEKAFEQAMAMLESAKFALDIPSDETRSEPRAPFITYWPSEETFDPTMTGRLFDGTGNSPRNPMLSRAMRF